MDSTEEVVARLDERLIGIGRQLDTIASEQKAAAEARRRVYEAQERTEREIIGLNHRLTAVEKSVESIRPTTEEYKQVRNNVAFAGKAGRLLWSISKQLLAAAAGAAAAWYAITGRPPP